MLVAALLVHLVVSARRPDGTLSERALLVLPMLGITVSALVEPTDRTRPFVLAFYFAMLIVTILLGVGAASSYLARKSAAKRNDRA